EKCEICGSMNKKILLNMSYLDKKVMDFISQYYNIDNYDIFKSMEYKILKCNNCGFIWQYHILNDALSKKLYNEWIDLNHSFKKKLFNKLLINGFFHEQLVIKSFFPHLYNHKIKILDYGAGWGFYCNYMKGYNFEVYAFEISNKKIHYIKEKFKIKLVSLNDIANYKFHYINLNQVLEHIENPRKTLKSLSNSLYKFGIIHISVPNGKNIEKKIKSKSFKLGINPIHPLEHINCFTPKSLINLSKILNLKMVFPKISFNVAVKYPYNALKCKYEKIFYMYRDTLSVYFQKFSKFD
ncbi:MAG: class I SAM-dependent methyltransferase, partial [Candidatus Helarchaeota archaeon]